MLSDDASVLLRSVFELQYCDAFQRYVQFNLVVSISRVVAEFVRLFIQMTGDSCSAVVYPITKDYRPQFSSLLQSVSSQLVSQFLQSLCSENFEFVCFIARVTLERCQASLSMKDIKNHSILSPICVALQMIFHFNDDTCHRLGFAVMKSRAFISQPGCQFTILSEAMLLRLTSRARVHPAECDARLLIKNIRALIVAVASNRQSLIATALMFELQQAIYMHVDAVQQACYPEPEVIAMIWNTLSDDPLFMQLSSQQLAQLFVFIDEDMAKCFENYKMDVSRCADAVSQTLACVFVTVLLNSQDTDSKLSSTQLTQLFKDKSTLFNQIVLYISQFMRSKYSEFVPISFDLALGSYVRCLAPCASSVEGSGAQMIDRNSKRLAESQHSQPQIEELLWSSVVQHQPLFVDSIVLDMLKRRTSAELKNAIEHAQSLQLSIKQSLNEIAQASSFDVLIQGASGARADIINGIYELSSTETNCGKSVWMKRGNSSQCIYFWSASQMWLVGPSENKGKDTTADAFFKHDGPFQDTFSKSGWHIYEGGGWNLHTTMRADHTRAASSGDVHTATSSSKEELEAKQTNSAVSVGGRASEAHVDNVRMKGCEAPTPQHILVVGAVCNKCRGTCESLFYWAPDHGLYMCLRCTFDLFLPKESLFNVRISSIFPTFQLPIFQKACLRSFLALHRGKVVMSSALGSPFVIRAQDDHDAPPPVGNGVLPVVDRFSANNSSLEISNSNRTLFRPAGSGCYPAATARPISNECSFQVVIDSETPSNNTLSFGVALNSFKMSDSNGVGLSSNSWGVMCSYGSSPTVSKCYSSGVEHSGNGHFRSLRKGDRLKCVVNFERKKLDFFLNDSEATFTFTLPTLKFTDCVFAMTLASNAQVTVLNQAHIIAQPMDSRSLDASYSLDNLYLWMQSIAQEVVHSMRGSTCDDESLVAWFDKAVSAVSFLLGMKSVGVHKPILLPSTPSICQVTQASESRLKVLTKARAECNQSVEAQSDASLCTRPETEKPVNGLGEFTYSNGAIYVGNWVNQKHHGKGAMFWTDGSFFQGEYSDGLKKGNGLYTWPDGSFFEGEYHEDKKHGTGVLQTADGTRYEGNFIKGFKEGKGCQLWRDGSSYEGDWSQDKHNGKGVMKYAIDGKSSSSSYTWNAGDIYNGDFKLGQRHGTCRYTFFSGEVFDCTWQDGRCPEFNAKQSAVLTAVAESKAELELTSLLSFSIARNALLFAARNFGSSQAYSLQLLPSVLTMCHDAISFATFDPFSSASLKHLLICDLMASTVSIAEIQTSISECIGSFIHDNFLRTLKLYIGLHAAFSSVLDHLVNVSQHESHASISCTSMYKQHAAFIQNVVCAELLEQLPTVSADQFMEVVGSIAVSGRISSALLSESFVATAQSRSGLAKWVVRVIPNISSPAISKDLYDFILSLSGLTDGKSGLSCENAKNETGLLFLQDLHVAYFHADGTSSVEAWSSASKFVGSILKIHNETISDLLLETLVDIRIMASQYMLPRILGHSRLRLFESIMETLLALSEELGRTPAQSWSSNQAFMSLIDVLSPWVPCIRGLSMNHSAVMTILMKHIGLRISIFVASFYYVTHF